MRSTKQFTHFRAHDFFQKVVKKVNHLLNTIQNLRMKKIQTAIGIFLFVMILIEMAYPAQANAQAKCLDSKARLIGFSVEFCTTSVIGIEGYLQYDSAYVYDFAEVTITSPEMLQVRVYVLQDNVMPPGFSTGTPKSVLSPGDILTEIERQYNVTGVNRIANSTQITVNGNVIDGLSFDTSPENPDIAARSSYWSIELNSHLLIIEIKAPKTGTGVLDSMRENYSGMSLNIMPDTTVIKPTEPSYTAELKGNYPIPSWWSGDCNVNHHPNSVVMGAFLGVYICSAPGNDRAFYFPGSTQIEFEWQCVEFVMRYMYLAYGTMPYQTGGGHGVYTNYSWTSGQRLDKIPNGKVGKYPKRGDVMSFESGIDGHTSVVKSSTVDSNGNGSYVTMNQNSGQYVVQTINVTKWNAGAIGWLHAPTFPAPAGVSASKNQIKKVVVTWAPVTGAIRYDVWRYRTNVPTAAERIALDVVSPYEDTTGVIGQSYNYWVTACNGDECSEFSTHSIGNSIDRPTDTPTNTPTRTSTATLTSTSTRTLTATATSTFTPSTTPKYRVYLPLVIKENLLQPPTPTYTPTTTPFTTLFYLKPALNPAYTGNLCTAGWLRINGFQSDYSYLTLNTNQAASSGYTATYSLTVEKTGNYRLSNWVADHAPIGWACPTKTINSDSSKTPFRINHANGQAVVYVNQVPVTDNWATVGTYSFTAGVVYKIIIFDLNTEADWSTTISAGTLRAEYVP